LEATTSNDLAQIAWFETETGDDAPIHVGSRYTTVSLTESRTFYVSEYHQTNGAYGLRKAVRAFVYERPTVEIGGDVTICNKYGGTYDLKEDEPSNYSGGEWSVDGEVIADGVITASSEIESQEVVYTYTNDNNCSSTDSKTVYFGPSTEAFAGEDRVVSLVSGGQTVESFDLTDLSYSPIGGSWSTDDPVLSGRINNTNLEVDVSNLDFTDVDGYTAELFYTTVDNASRCEVSDTVSLTFVKLNNTENVLTVQDGITCGTGRVDLTANTETGYTLRWYEEQIGGANIATGTTFETPSISTSRTYYVEVYDSESGVTSMRKVVNAEVGTYASVTVPSEELVFCNAEEDISLLRYVEPSGGDFISDYTDNSGNLVIDSLNGATSITVTYSFTNSTGCTASDDFDIRIGSSNTNVDAGSGYASCEGDNSISLSASPSGGTWYFEVDSLNAKIANSTINTNGIAVGEYALSYVYETESGCQISDNTSLEIFAQPNMPVVADVDLCGEGSTEIEVDAEDGYSYEWFENVNDTEPIHTGQTYQTETLTTDETFYVRSENSNGCVSDKASVRVSVNAIPTVDVGSDLFFCDQDVEIDLSEYENIAGGSWSGQGVVNGIFKGFELQRGSYTLTYEFTSAEGCIASDELVVVLGLEPTLTQNKENLEVGESVNFGLDLGTAIKNIKWSFGDGFTSTEENPNHFYYKKGVYTINVEVELENGCSGVYTYEDVVAVSGEEVSIITANEQKEDMNMSIYPNPVMNELKIKGNFNGKAELVLVDQKGVRINKIVKENIFNDDALFVNDIHRLQSGVYHVIIKTDKNIQTLKFVKK